MFRDRFDDDEDDEPKESEFTLGIGALLAIFFGLVLLCGLFFGFGYTLGHGHSARNNDNPSAAIPASAPSTTSQLTTGGAKPAAQQEVPPPTPAATTAAATTTPASPTSAGTTQPTAQPAAQPVAQAQTATPGAAQHIFQAAVPRTPSQMASQTAASDHQYMVQVAAVSRPQDASVLVSALRQRGFHAVTRSSEQDHLMHVQIGPFASRDAANQMRSRLIAAGYNAILKP